MPVAMVDDCPAKSERQPKIPAPHALSSAEVLEHLDVSTDAGLSAKQVNSRHDEYGPNILDEIPPTSLWRKFARQFASLLVGILIAAAIVSCILSEWAEAVAIVAIVLLNGIIGLLQEEKAERALESLREFAAPSCRVTRDGRDQLLASAQLLPGDVIHVEAGDQVSADGRLLQAIGLSTQEAALPSTSTPRTRWAG